MSDLSALGRLLILFGIVLVAVGGLIWLLGRVGIPLGNLPGDIKIEGQYLTCIVPIASSIILSIILTLLINFVIRLLNR